MSLRRLLCFVPFAAESVLIGVRWKKVFTHAYESDTNRSVGVK